MRPATKSSSSLLLFSIWILIAAVSPAQKIEVVGAIGGKVTDVQVEGNIAYIARGANLEIEDVSDPENPKLLSRTHVPKIISALAHYRRVIYLAVPEAGLVLIDAADPARPKLLEPMPDSECISLVAVIGDRLVRADARAGSAGSLTSIEYWFLFNLDDPLDPNCIASAMLPHDEDVLATETMFFLLHERRSETDKAGASSQDPNENSDMVIEILYRRYHEHVRLTIPGVWIAGPGYTMSYDEESMLLFIVSGDDEQRIAVSVRDPQQLHYTFLDKDMKLPTLTEEEPVELWFPKSTGGKRSYQAPINPQFVTIVGSTALVLCDETGLVTVDISDPANPRPLSRMELQGDSGGIVPNGSFAYVGNNVLDITDPRAPIHLRTDELPLGYMTLLEDFGYMTHYDKGLIILDLSDPAAPKTLNLMPSDERWSDIGIVRGHAVLTGWRRMSVLSLNDPVNPRIIGTLPEDYSHLDEEGDRVKTTIAASGMVSWGDRILTRVGRCWESGCVLLDFANPVNPGLIGVFEGGTQACLNADWACFSRCHEGTGGPDFHLMFHSLRDIAREPIRFDGVNSMPVITTDGEYFYVPDEEAGLVILKVDYF